MKTVACIVWAMASIAAVCSAYYIGYNSGIGEGIRRASISAPAIWKMLMEDNRRVYEQSLREDAARVASTAPVG